MQRICKYCSKEYEGDPGSSACPKCVAQNKSTTLRPRQCRACGTTFQGGPRAWYCPDCRREQNRELKKTEPKRKFGDIDKCVICGGDYTVTGGLQKYCPDCRRKQKLARDMDWKRTHNQIVNEQQRRRYKDRLDSMTPEEKEAYRKKVSAVNHENYEKRKERKKND